ncbi:hypothetical protein OC846_002142 [Tilletia horrida]|uniref:BZIP domain-containing protein n=1 Tax=Tilletia horrida TaxID=155126 RepID=A0AAN6GV73_9BASI|nr:hypothetical protein OC846_002142 [Tilletia horrida]KAK0570197.1 hypothetical protein OC861_000146 [Tilletia horrida]
MATALQQAPAKLPLLPQSAAQQQQQQQDAPLSEDSIALTKPTTNPLLADSIEDYLNLPSPAPSNLKQSRLSPAGAAAAATTAPASTLKAPAKPNISAADMQTLAATAPVAAASLAHGPPPPGSSPEVLFRYYLASELRRMGSPFDDSVIDKYVKQHTKTLDAARKVGSNTPAARASPPASSASIPSDPLAAAALQTAQPSGDILSGLAPMSASITPSPFKFTAAGMTAQVSASVDTASIFSSAAVGSAVDSASINPHLVQLDNMSRSNTETDAAIVTVNHAKVKEEHMTPKIQAEDLMDINESEHEHHSQKEEDEDEELDDEEDDLNTSNSFNDANGKKSGFGSTTASPSSVLGVPASLASISEDMRPSAEEYRKLSSKEKRQLRNKISARNFRTRRKEYIGQLEDQIADRDQIIEGLRLQVAKLTTSNRELTEEVKTLKAQSLSQMDVSRILEALTSNMTVPAGSADASASSASTGLMGPPAALPLPQASQAAQVAATPAAVPTSVTLPTLAGPALFAARTPMRTSNSSNSLTDLFGITSQQQQQRPDTPMQTSRPSTPLSPLFPALGASGSNSLGSGAPSGFSPLLRPSLARRPSPANFNMGGSSIGSSSGLNFSFNGSSSSSSSVPTLGHAGPITQPNTKKDVAPNASADSFWAGSSGAGASGSSPFGAGANGFTPVYMTLVDELSFPPVVTAPASVSSNKSSNSNKDGSVAAAKLAEMLMEKLRFSSPACPAYNSSAKSVTARSEVEDAFSRLLLDSDDVVIVDADAEIPPTYQEAIGSSTLLLAGPVPTYCKV